MVSSNNPIPGSDSVVLKIERLYVKEINCNISHASGLFEITKFKESVGEISPSIGISTNVQTVAKNKREFEKSLSSNKDSMYV
jgi:preprotein translocase subunit SecB